MPTSSDVTYFIIYCQMGQRRTHNIVQKKIPTTDIRSANTRHASVLATGSAHRYIMLNMEPTQGQTVKQARLTLRNHPLCFGVEGFVHVHSDGEIFLFITSTLGDL